ncbi:sulfatase [uncultured Polaribacter sp.]|uniref:sulfatase n=1 Tax=uncultured Polaribacter sp. TaxID=174711 RepID=UPI002624A59C|nr:sulfatase [uncultured Polaribacter sp.]
MKYFLSFFFGSLLIFSCTEEEAKKPNIIFILADDYGIVDTQAYVAKFLNTSIDSTFYETPNINKLMKEGVSFSQAYANQLCSPTRASILTGKYAARIGFTTAMPHRNTYYNQNLEVPQGYYANDVLEHKDNILIEQPHINATSNSGVSTGKHTQTNLDELSIAEAMTDYQSAFIGKWHIGGFGAKGFQPKDNGFKTLAYFDGGGSTYFNWKKPWNQKSKDRFPKMPQQEWEIGDSGKDTGEKYLTDDLTTQALHYIEEKAKDKDKPFFLYFSHFAVHTPYQGKKGEIEYFNAKETKGFNGQDDAIYASMIKSMDRSVGKILDKLKETGIEENTLVVFMSDNGGIDAEITPNNQGTENSPFLGGKACLTEGGIRVPLIFRWKGKIESGKWVDTPVDCTDIFPTILEAAGYNAKQIVKENDLDGESILGLLSDQKNEQNTYTKDTHFWHYPFNVIYKSPYDGYALTPHSAIRKRDFKLIFDWYGRLHLYNIEKDPYEKNDLYSSNKEQGDVLFKELVSWLEKNVAKRYWPKINPDYNPEKEVRKTPFKDLMATVEK